MTFGKMAGPGEPRLAFHRRSRIREVLAATFLVVVIAAAVSGPLWMSDPNAIDLSRRFVPPSALSVFGTDELGRDVLARVVNGGRISLLVGFVSAALALVVGATLGAAAGYFGGATDWAVSRIVETMLSFPLLILVLAISAVVHPSVTTTILALGLSSWPQEARLTRGEVLRVKGEEYTDAARASGAGNMRIVFRHLLPNAINPAIVSATFGVSSAILAESALSFLGFGVPLPTASWGNILGSAEGYVGHAWWLMVFPGLAIVLTVVAINTLSEWLRDWLDPVERHAVNR